MYYIHQSLPFAKILLSDEVLLNLSLAIFPSFVLGKLSQGLEKIGKY